MTWAETLQNKMSTAIGQFGVEKLFDSVVTNYLNQSNREDLSDPHRLIMIYIEVYGYSILQSKEVKSCLLKTLCAEQLKRLAHKLDIEISSNESLLVISNIITDSSWGIHSKKSEKFWSFFELDGLFDEAKDYYRRSDHLIDKVSSVDGASDRFYELHSYQSQVKHDVLDFFNRQNFQKILLQLPTGSGKTRVAIHTLISYLLDSCNSNKHVLWLAYEPLLLEQAANSFEKIWPILGLGKINILKMYGNYKDVPAKGELSICFANVVTLERKYPQFKSELNSKISLIIFDEAHQIIANKSKTLLTNMFYGNDKVKLLGLTATPGRNYFDEAENRRLVEFFDENLVNINVPSSGITLGSLKTLDTEMEKEKSAIRYLQKECVLAKIEHHIIKTDRVVTPKMQSVEGEVYKARILKEIEADDKRNKKIIDELQRLNTLKKKTVVFACSVNHAKALVILLKLENIRAELVIGENISERQSVLSRFVDTSELNILVNYEVLTTGFDAPCIDALIVARPTSSIVTYSQMLGRALRGTKNGGHDTNMVFNVETSEFGDEVDAYMSFGNYWE